MITALLLVSLSAAPPDGDAAAFKRFFAKGEELFEQGDYGAAIWNFRQADALRHTPEVAFDLGKCHDKVGDQAYATYYYRLYLRRAPKAADVLEVAERIGEAISEAEADGRGLLEVESFTSGKAVLAGVTYQEFPIAVFLPPGDYELTASFPGGKRKRMVSIHTGKVNSITFEPLAPPLLSSTGDEPSPDFGQNARISQGHSPQKWKTPAYAVLGGSVAALLVGTVMGGMASADEARLTRDRAELTVSGARGLAASSNLKGGAANVLWAVGAAGAITGGVMWVFSLPEPGAKR